MPALSDILSATEGSALDSHASSPPATDASGSLPHPAGGSQVQCTPRPHLRHLCYGTSWPASTMMPRVRPSAENADADRQLRLLTPSRPQPGRRLFQDSPNDDMRNAALQRAAAAAYSHSLLAARPPEAPPVLLRLPAGSEREHGDASEPQPGGHSPKPDQIEDQGRVPNDAGRKQQLLNPRALTCRQEQVPHQHELFSEPPQGWVRLAEWWPHCCHLLQENATESAVRG